LTLSGALVRARSRGEVGGGDAGMQDLEGGQKPTRGVVGRILGLPCEGSRNTGKSPNDMPGALKP